MADDDTNVELRLDNGEEPLRVIYTEPVSLYIARGDDDAAGFNLQEGNTVTFIDKKVGDHKFVIEVDDRGNVAVSHGNITTIHNIYDLAHQKTSIVHTGRGNPLFIKRPRVELLSPNDDK